MSEQAPSPSPVTPAGKERWVWGMAGADHHPSLLLREVQAEGKHTTWHGLLFNAWGF